MRHGSKTLLWIVSRFQDTLSIEGIEKDESVAKYSSLLKVAYRTFTIWILRKKTLYWSLIVEIETPNCISVILFTLCHPSGSSLEIVDELNSSLQGNAKSSRIDLAGDVFTLYWLVYRSTGVFGYLLGIKWWIINFVSWLVIIFSCSSYSVIIFSCWLKSHAWK